ncbi:MAG: hypothetical protein A3G93_10485 [Nitrospinae bacterium RIFCSPLOWO2_12_FULL_45_22]|nr:MAG: hypothetical protein A3G93_10485 [Nitrospinae bacterium RIFCSPLOWO2_12_FULL_45_22]
MSIRKLSLMFLILILLGSYFYFYEIKRKGALQKAEEAGKKVFSLKKEDIVELKLKKGDKNIVCRKGDGNWNLEKPLQAPADSITIDAVLSSLLGLSRERAIEDKVADLSPYGLKDPDIEVVLKSNKDKVEGHALYVGDKNPTGSFLYVRQGNNPEVFLVPSSLEADLSKEVNDFRDKTAVKINPHEIQKVEFIRDGQQIRCELDQAKQWTIVEPIKYRANEAKIKDFLDKVRELKIKEFVDEDPKELNPYGLDHPSQELAFWSKNKEGSPVRLYLGMKDEGEKGVYAKHSDKKNVFLVEEGFITYLPQRVEELRDPYLLRFDPEKVIKLGIQSPAEGNIICTIEHDHNWQLQAPVKVKADAQEIDTLLTNLKELKVKEFISDEPKDLQEYGLASAQISYNIWEKNQKEPKTLLLGKEESPKTGFYAKIENQPNIFLINQEDVKKITKKVFDLRDKSILAFEVSDINKIQLRYPDKEILLEKEGDEWKLLKPQEAKAKYVKVLDLLWELNGLKFKDIASEQGTILPEYGLDKPQIQITLWKGKGESWGTLLLGATTPDKKYLFAKTASHPTIYKVSPDFLKNIPTDPAGLQG